MVDRCNGLEKVLDVGDEELAARKEIVRNVLVVFVEHAELWNSAHDGGTADLETLVFENGLGFLRRRVDGVDAEHVI